MHEIIPFIGFIFVVGLALIGAYLAGGLEAEYMASREEENEEGG